MSKRFALHHASLASGTEGVTITGTQDSDSLIGGQFDDVIFGDLGDDTLRGGDGNDLLFGENGTDQLFGGNGDDTVSVYGSFGADDLRGGLGIDLLVYESGPNMGTPDVSFTLAYETTLPDDTTATGFERLYYTGTTGADVVTGGNWDDILIGDLGADVLTGRDGNDLLVSGPGATLYGGDGDDTLIASLFDGTLLSGGAGDDLIRLDFRFSGAKVVLSVADMQAGTFGPEGGSIKGVEQADIFGSDFADVLTGGQLDDTLLGHAGQDSLSGAGGSDYLNGGRGDDTLNGGDGKDVLYESQGTNVMYGADGDDSISVGLGIQKSQFMYGGYGDDTIMGSVQADILNGGAGSDQMTGRAGADRFVFNLAPVAGDVDTILDFGVGADKIVLSSAVFTGLTAGSLAAADFVAGTAAVDGSDRILYDAATKSVWYDADGVGGVDAVKFLTVTTLTAFDASDFLIS